MSNELKPCPFCGARATTDNENGLWVVGCNDPEDSGCPAAITWGHYPREAEAIAAWNTRPAPDDAEPVAWMLHKPGGTPYTTAIEENTSGWSHGITPLYTRPAPDDAAERRATIDALAKDKIDLRLENAALRQRVERLEGRFDGNRALPIDRDSLGRLVREAWVRWAETQPSPKSSWLVPYDDLSECDKEADRQIGEAIARWTLIGDASCAALTEQEGEQHD